MGANGSGISRRVIDYPLASLHMNENTSEGSQRHSIRTCATEDEARWDAFVEAAPDGTFYHLSGWKRIFEDTLGHRTWYLFCEYDGQIEAVLPLAQVRSLMFGNALISVPFLVYGGPLATSSATAEMLIGKAIELGRELDVDYVELRHRTAPKTDQGSTDWIDNCSYVTFRKRISPDPEENMLAIPRKQRAMIRKGIKAGLRAEEDDNADRLHAALLECKRNLGTPFFGRDYLQAIKDEFRSRAEILTVTRQNSLVCSVMSFRFRDEILPYYGGGGRIARDYYGNDFMYWAVMEKACKNGVRIFDYGRSRENTGAYRFKKHWGFEPTRMHYQYHLVRAAEEPELSPSNPKFQLLINIWRRLPLPLAGKLGPPIARRLG